MIYDRPTWQLLEGYVSAHPSPFSRQDILEWFRKNYPSLRETTVTAHIRACCVNVNREGAPTLHDVIWKRPDGLFEKYSPRKHETEVTRLPRRLPKQPRPSAEPRSVDIATYLDRLGRAEQAAIVDTIAFMCFNPAIGRVLEKGAVRRFANIAAEYVRRLADLHDSGSFDNFLADFIREVSAQIRTSRHSLASFGEAQKAVNVFLKVYVDWASLPNPQVASALRRFLHVPLDRLLMEKVRSDFHEQWADKVRPSYRRSGVRPSDSSLKNINRDVYSCWQDLLRSICPWKPVLLDVLWWQERKQPRTGEH